jgi:phage terminase large subunit
MGTIFPEWNVIPDEQFPKDAKIIYGIDYGYTNDPTAIVKIARVGESLFLHECAYESGIPAKTIIQLLKANGYNNEPVYSEHDPDMISQIRRLGVPILMARKGQGSINAGIMKLKEYKVFMTASSKNLKTEQTNYCWMNVDGKPINTPIDNFCHLIDATRYGVYTHYFKPQ